VRTEKEDEPEVRHPSRGETKHTQDDEGQQEAAPVGRGSLLEMRHLAHSARCDLRRLPLRERRRLLEPLVAGREGAVRLSEEVQADGDEFFRVACEHGLEGIIAKHVEKPYRSGRGEWWQKITCTRRNSFVIVGFEPSTVPGHLGRLLLAALRGGELVYVGGCGTGWSHELSRELRNLLESIATKTPAVNLRRKNAVFTEPVLIAEVEYRAWTDDWKLRHASFKGIREREDEASIYDLRPY